MKKFESIFRNEIDQFNVITPKRNSKSPRPESTFRTNWTFNSHICSPNPRLPKEKTSSAKFQFTSSYQESIVKGDKIKITHIPTTNSTRD